VDSSVVEVVHESVWRELLASEGISLGVPEAPVLPLGTANIKPDIIADMNITQDKTLHSRQSCGATRALVTDTVQTFIDWDVQMSPVVIGVGTNGLTVFVSAGYSVSNSITVSAGVEWGIVKDLLSISTKVDYSRTWTTNTAYQMSGNVPNGYSGVWITKPVKTRRYGRVLTGCIGSQKATGTFQADEFKQGSYNGLSWVQGAITMCVKKEFPLSRCHGRGNFI
jgi:hypothetical protein